MHDWSWLSFDEKPRHTRKGAALFRQDATVERMYYISSGRVKLMRHTREGDTVIMRIDTSREMIAEASLFSESYHCTAVVDQPSEIYTIDRDTALVEVFKSSRSSREILKLFSGHIRDLRSLIEIRNIRSAQKRILAYPESIAEHDGKVRLYTSLRDIAYKLGLTHETMYRELRTLEESGMLDRSEPETIKLR